MSEKPTKNTHDYRVGNPVSVKETVTSIAALPREAGDPFGYKVTGSADAIQEQDIDPIPITEDILENYGFKYNRDTEYWSFEANGHVLWIDSAGDCSIDGKGHSHVKHLHVLTNLLFDECDGFVLRRYYGPLNKRKLESNINE